MTRGGRSGLRNYVDGNIYTSPHTHTKESMFKVIHNKVFGIQTVVSLGQSDEDLETCLDIAKLPKVDDYEFLYMDEIDGFSGRTLMDNSGLILMRVNTAKRTVNSLAVIQHEIFHIVDFLLQFIDTPLTDETNEVYAYLIEYYTREIYFQIIKG